MAVRIPAAERSHLLPAIPRSRETVVRSMIRNLSRILNTSENSIAIIWGDYADGAWAIQSSEVGSRTATIRRRNEARRYSSKI